MPSHPKTSHPFSDHRFSVKHLGAFPTLAANRLLGFAAASMSGLFFAIFLYEFFEFSLQMVLIWFAVAYAIRIPLIIWAAKIFSKTGLVPSMVFGTIGTVIFFLCSYFLDIGLPEGEMLFLFVAALGLAVSTAFYWTPFHVDFAEFSKKGHRGMQVALMSAAESIIAVGAPVFGGFLVSQYSYGVIFIFGISMLLMSLLPLAIIPRTDVVFEFGFWETFKKMAEKEFRPMSLTYIARGAENAVGVVIWPIFLFAIFDGAYLDIGIFAAIIVIISLGLQLFIGRQIDRKKSKKLLRWGTEIYSAGWAGKALVDTVSGVFAASTFHGLGAIFMTTPLKAIYYEQAADSGHYIDEYSVVRELAITMGRVFMTLALLIVTIHFSFAGAFIAAAIVSLGINSLARYKRQV